MSSKNELRRALQKQRAGETLSETDKTLIRLAEYRKRKSSGHVRNDRTPAWLVALQHKRRAYAVARRTQRKGGK